MLLERDAERGLVEDAVRRAVGGEGGVVRIEGAAGLGKTALLQEVRAQASELVALSALGSELERDFPFGVVRQLFEPVVRRADDARRARLLGGAAETVAPLVGGGGAPEAALGDAPFATLHGLYWLTAALADEGPLLLVLDDAHWADAPSLRFLDFLARRVHELPVVVCFAVRPDEAGAEHELLESLGGDPRAVLVRCRPLTEAGIDAFVRSSLDAAVPDDVVAGAATATGGNPLLLRELTRTLAEDGAPPTAEAVQAAVPSSVTRTVERRLERLDPDARRMAHALAVLGDGRGTALVADVAQLDPDTAADALDALHGVGLVEDEPARFVHPLLRAAVADATPAAQRGALHRAAAGLLRDRPGADEELVLHLLATAPLGEDWTVAFLRRSAARAMGEGAPEAAVRRLERAIEELSAGDPALDDVRLELALATLGAGDAAAADHLARAARSSRLDIVGQALTLEIVVQSVEPSEGMRPKIEQLEATIGALDEGPLRDALRAQEFNALLTDTRFAPDWRRAIDALGPEPPVALLPAVTLDAAARDVDAAGVRSLAARALAHADLTDPGTMERAFVFMSPMALLTVEGAELADAALRDMQTTLRRGSSRAGSAILALVRGYWELAYGTAGQALAEAEQSITLWEAAGLDHASMGSRLLAMHALIRQGRVDEAEAAFARLPDLTHRFVAAEADVIRAMLLLERGRIADAVVRLRSSIARDALFGWTRTPYDTARADLARALALNGEREEARELAESEAAIARKRGTHGLEAAALCALGAATDGDESLQAFAAAAEAGERTQWLHWRAIAKIEYGCALRRAGQRTDARTQLTEGRDVASRSDSRAMMARATDELLLAGGRPRRTATSGIDSLTPAERRVAEHAARGLNNREIAETLFVTRKTVEHTLGRVFSKLDIRSRTQLPERFAGVVSEG